MSIAPPPPDPQSGTLFLLLDGVSEPEIQAPVLVAFNQVSRLFPDPKNSRTTVTIGGQLIKKGYINRSFNTACKDLMESTSTPFPRLTQQRGGLLFNIDLIRPSGTWEEGAWHDKYMPQDGLIMPAHQIIRIFPSRAGKVILRRAESIVDGYVDMDFPTFIDKLKTAQAPAP